LLEITIAHPLGMVVGMGTTTQRPLHIVGEDPTLTATTVSTEVLRRTVNQENSWGKLVRDLAGKVGGLASLESLHVEPLPDEPFDHSVVADVDRPFVAAVIALFDEQSDRRLDVEYRTIGRRLFARALLNSPTLIRKSSSPVRFAAGLAHAVLAVNDCMGRAEGQMRAKDIASWFGSSSAGDPARRLVEAARFEGVHSDDDDYDWRYRIDGRLRILSTDFLHSAARARLLGEREHVVAAIERHEAAQAGRRPTVSLDDGRTSRRGSLANVITVTTGLTKSGQTMLLLGLAPLVPSPEPDIFVLNLAEANRLCDRLGAALSVPTPGGHRIGDFDAIDDEWGYCEPDDDPYWR
jgi:Domain of unknown function (DUF6398)